MKRLTLAALSVLAVFGAIAPATFADSEYALDDRFDKERRETLQSLSDRFEDERDDTLNALSDRFEEARQQTLDA